MKKEKQNFRKLIVTIVVIVAVFAVGMTTYSVYANHNKSDNTFIVPQSEKLPGDYSALSDIGIKNTSVVKNDDDYFSSNLYNIESNNGNVESVSFNNGEVLLISDKSGAFDLSAGENISVLLKLNLDEDYSDKYGEHISFGTYSGGEVTELFNGIVAKDGLEFKVSIPDTGSYEFFVRNLSAGVINIDRIEIGV